MIKNCLQLIALILVLGSCASNNALAQKGKKQENSTSALDKVGISGLKFRNVGPALTSGRISDFAVVDDPGSRTYYVATASGGVWKTDNWGTTYKPIFDSQGSYSIGCITLDPNQNNVIWVGTGENNNQRSVAYGDGVYKSMDGGRSWKNMGLKKSEHIGMIRVHPENSDIVYVAAYGPLWSSGGERGLYRTKDGGKTWENILEVDKHTGVHEIHLDPRNPDVMYAVAHQRQRHVFTYLGGGPGSGIYKSVDGGQSWSKINRGLPGGDKGRIGMAISPADPDVMYAIVEAANGGGTFRSKNGGASWERRGSYSTSGNYYQEIIADLKDPNKLYSMNTWMQLSNDGGRTFRGVGEITKHVDNHCMWINPQNTDHWLVGCDGGVYETHDAAKTWQYKPNLPLIQFYKVATDNDAPFYNIYGGTQDNNSMGGPSRVTNAHGIRNSDWYITKGGDGFESQVDPENPNIVYAQSQHGVLARYDRSSGEQVGIQPKPRKGEKSYIWNWDAPLAVSKHKSGRLYFAANKLFRSDDRGNSWTVISDDLSRQLDRNKLKIMDRVWSIDAVAKNRSTSLYGAVVAFSESPVDENLLIVGTDDGLIQITENGGDTWRKVDNIPGVPSRTYVNSVYASQHDANVIYAAFNHHKYGDFKPYIFRSTDKGRTWTKIANNLPERGSVYSIEEDHVDPNLIFCGTEFGLFFSPDRGGHWKQLRNGLPTIAIRDIDIQRRENDLVLASFGRGFYVMDDYSALRHIEANGAGDEPKLYDSRPAFVWEEDTPLGLRGKAFMGDALYTAENLGPVAMLTYYLPETPKTLRGERKKEQGKNSKAGKDNRYPTYEELTAENEQEAPRLMFTISDKAGKVVRKLFTSPRKGLHRMKWNMRYAPKTPISLRTSSGYNPYAGRSEGSLVAPGDYTVQMSQIVDGEITDLGKPATLTVKSLNNTTLPATNRAEKVAFQRDVAELDRRMRGAQSLMSEVNNKLRHIKKALEVIEEPYGKLYKDYKSLKKKMDDLSKLMYGDRNLSRLDIQQPPTPSQRLGSVVWEQKYSTSEPTQTHRDAYRIAKEEFAPIMEALRAIVETDLPAIEKKLEAADAPYTPGRALRMMNGH